MSSLLLERAALDAPRSLRVTGVLVGEWVVVSWRLRPLPSAPQITRRMGKSLAQLLTRRAVLIAVGLAAVGGGRGWMFWGGAVEVRREGSGGGCVAGGAGGGGADWGRGVIDGSAGLISLEEGGLVGVDFGGSAAAPSNCCCCAPVFTGGDAVEGLMVGVGGPDGKGVVSAVLVVPVFGSVPP